jgi:hypothetical protein
MKNMQYKLQTLATGALGATGIELADPINNAISQTPSNLVTTIIQVIIGIATLIKFFKPSKK